MTSELCIVVRGERVGSTYRCGLDLPTQFGPVSITGEVPAEALRAFARRCAGTFRQIAQGGVGADYPELVGELERHAEIAGIPFLGSLASGLGNILGNVLPGPFGHVARAGLGALGGIANGQNAGQALMGAGGNLLGGLLGGGAQAPAAAPQAPAAAPPGGLQITPQMMAMFQQMMGQLQGGARVGEDPGDIVRQWGARLLAAQNGVGDDTAITPAQITAAREFATYLRRPRAQRSRAATRVLQAAIGGVDVDGLVGPQTIARVNAIISAARALPGGGAVPQGSPLAPDVPAAPQLPRGAGPGTALALAQIARGNLDPEAVAPLLGGAGLIEAARRVALPVTPRAAQVLQVAARATDALAGVRAGDPAAQAALDAAADAGQSNDVIADGLSVAQSFADQP